VKPRSRHRSLLLLVVAALVATGVGAIFKATDALPEIELSTIDRRLDIRGAQTPRTDVVVVGMDERTLDTDPNAAIPFNRRRHARVIEQLTKAGARVIAYDIQFTEPSAFPDADEALIEAVRASPRVVLSTTEVLLDGSTEIFGGGETLEYTRATPALGTFENDDDGVLRHMAFSEQGLETFAMAAARLQVGHPIRTPGSSTARIDFAGPPGTFPQLSFGDVERGSFDADAVRGKVVVVGATAAEFNDLHKTAAGDDMPGPELQASAIATALDGFPLHGAGWEDWLLVLALGSIAPLVAMRFGTAGGLIAGILAVPAFLVGAQLAFNAGVIVSIIPPLAAAFTALVGTALVANPASSPWVNRVLDRVSSGEGMNLRTRRLRALMLLGTAFFIVVFGLAFQAGHVFERLEYVAVDNRFDIRGTQPPGPVAVVAIDDDTFNDLGSEVFPFTRNLHARVIRQLKKAGAKVIVYDVQFTEQSPDPDADTNLIDAVRAAGNVVLSSTEISDAGTTRIFGGGEALAFSRGIPGNGNVENDGDGRVRRMLYSSQNLESLPMAALRFARKGDDVPHPPGESAWIDYAGPPHSVPYLSFGKVAKGEFPASVVRGKYVVVGAEAPSLQDLHQTSTTGSGEMPGPEIWANAIATGLKGFPLRTIPWWVDSLLLVLLAVITPLAALRMRTGFALALGIATLVAFLVGAQLAFEDDVIITVAYPLLAALVAMAATAAIHGLTVAFERANTRDAFARFVPESVVDQVLADADGVRLGGVRGEATVMFSDLRGFTSFAETLEPEQVIAALNLYLTAMSEAILDHGGTLVAYMGDGIMAVFGAPLHQEDHADRALAAARDMLDRLVGFNDSLRQDSLHEGFKMGIGLNTGAVMSGNVGSERRLEYTALGDTTNTAARLEGMTKGTPYQLYVSDSTRAALLQPADDLVEVGEFEVRGRKAKIKLWSLAETAGDSPPPPADADAENETGGAQPPTRATVTEGS
jgi:adenylate cyclase